MCSSDADCNRFSPWRAMRNVGWLTGVVFEAISHFAKGRPLMGDGRFRELEAVSFFCLGLPVKLRSHVIWRRQPWSAQANLRNPYTIIGRFRQRRACVGPSVPI